MKVIFEVSSETSTGDLVKMSNAMIALTGGGAALASSGVKATVATDGITESLNKVKAAEDAAAAAAAATGKGKGKGGAKPAVDPGDLEPAAEAKPVKMEQIRALVQAKALAGKKDEIKAALEKYGVEKVPELDKANYQSFYDEIDAL